jgi:hypothetical protein
MAAFQGILSGLRRAEQQLERQLANVRSAITSLAGGTGARRGRPARSKNKRGLGRPARTGIRVRRKMSAAARAKISAAQKARWAKQKASEKKK